MFPHYNQGGVSMQVAFTPKNGVAMARCICQCQNSYSSYRGERIIHHN